MVSLLKLFLLSCGSLCSAALTHVAVGWSAVYDCVFQGHAH